MYFSYSNVAPLECTTNGEAVDEPLNPTAAVSDSANGADDTAATTTPTSVLKQSSDERTTPKASVKIVMNDEDGSKEGGTSYEDPDDESCDHPMLRHALYKENNASSLDESAQQKLGKHYVRNCLRCAAKLSFTLRF